jgi:hypothetical protein
MTSTREREPLTELMRISPWGTIDGISDESPIGDSELILLRKTCAAIGRRLGIGPLRLSATSDLANAIYLVQKPDETVVFAGPPEADRLGDRLRDVDPYLLPDLSDAEEVER